MYDIIVPLALPDGNEEVDVEDEDDVDEASGGNTCICKSKTMCSRQANIPSCTVLKAREISQISSCIIAREHGVETASPNAFFILLFVK